MLLLSFIVILLFSIKLVHSDDPVANPPCGPLIGTNVKLDNGKIICAFKGIPYGKPPINSLRFKSPQPVDPWTQPRKAQKDSPRCIQPFLPKQSEDCLYLSVFTPTVTPEKPLAVLVYFYGGIFDFGSTQDYGPDYLLQDVDIIFIVVNSRGSLFGFLSFGDEVVTGNMGLKDCRLALQWIQTNIHSFGGDASKVTIWGLSSGAVIVHSLMTYASDQGLFRAGITNSGTCLTGFGFRSPTEVTKMKYMIAKFTKCPEDSEGLLKCLQGKSATEILLLYEIQYHFLPVDGIDKFIPLVGPVMEPECVADRFVTSNPWNTRVNVPWMGGVTDKEALLFLSPAINDFTNLLFKLLEHKFDDWFPLLMNYQNSIANGSAVVQAARQYYLQGKPISRDTLSQIVDLLADAYFVYGHYEAVKRADTANMFFYLLGYKGKHEMTPIRESGRVGARHADELWFFFRQPGLPFHLPRFDTEEDKKMSKTLIKLWTNFAIYLHPTPDNSLGVDWVPFFNNEAYLHFKQDEMVIENKFRPEQMKFWDSQPYPNRDDGDYRNIPCEGYGKEDIIQNSSEE